MKRLLLTLMMLVPVAASAAGGGHADLDEVDIDMGDTASLQRGAEIFVDYCASCHGAQYMRYQRIGEDLGMSPEDVKARLVRGDAKIGETMTNAAMTDDYARDAFGAVPPDLSLVARVRGADWLYTYLRSFYRDPDKALGVNNALFPDVSMPHVFWREQGIQEAVYKTEKGADGETHETLDHLELAEPGTLSPDEFDAMIRDLVNFMVYMGEPSQIQAHRLAPKVIGFLLIFLVIIFLLKREYWKDVKSGRA